MILGRRGPPPTPSNLVKLRGNPGKRPINKSEPTPPPGIAQPPEWLKHRGKRLWHLIAPVLDEMGVLTSADPHALALLCDAYAEYIECREVVRAEGRTYESISYEDDGEVIGESEDGATLVKEVTVVRRMVRARPEVAMAADAWRRIRAMMQEFGLTPSSRSRIATRPAEDEDEFEAFTRGHQQAT